MARRKAEEPASIEGGWINTFADLMNLLLCFFVLLFSMSTVDADKYEQIVTSLSESIDIFSDGGNAVGEGAFVSSGTSQKISMEEYFNEFENSGQDQELKRRFHGNLGGRKVQTKTGRAVKREDGGTFMQKCPTKQRRRKFRIWSM